MDQNQKSTVKCHVRIRQDLTEKRFGKLTVLEYINTGENASKWKCRCDCGTITYKATGHLNAGTVTNCGCLNAIDLVGKRFGKLVVLEKSDYKKARMTYWKCQCDCGNTVLKPTGCLKNGTATSCGCGWRQPAVHEGERFGRLTAMQPTDKRQARSVIWVCQCDCGNVLEVRATSLKSGHTTSCGCVKGEIDKEKDFKDILTYTNDTCIEFLQNIGKTRTNTSAETGVRGVTVKGGKYQAQIYFRKHRYYLGRFTRLEDAIKARKHAEYLIEEYLEEYLAGNPEPSLKGLEML